MKTFNELEIDIPEKIPEGNFYITIKTPFNTKEFLVWVADKYQGESATTFTPIATKSGSFRADKKEQDCAKTELRFCLGLDIKDIDPAIDAFVDQVKKYSEYLKN